MQPGPCPPPPPRPSKLPVACRASLAVRMRPHRTTLVRAQIREAAPPAGRPPPVPAGPRAAKRGPRRAAADAPDSPKKESRERKAQRELQRKQEEEEHCRALEDAEIAEALQPRPVPRPMGQAPRGPPRTLFYAQDTPLELSPTNVLQVEDLRALVLGQAPEVGVHALLVVDLKPLPQAAWWWGYDEDEGAHAVQPEVYFKIEASDRQCLAARLPPHSAGLGSYYLRKAFAGHARPSPRKGLTQPQLQSITVDDFFGFMEEKLQKQPGAVVYRQTEDDPNWDFVGDMLLAEGVQAAHPLHNKVLPGLSPRPHQLRHWHPHPPTAFP